MPDIEASAGLSEVTGSVNTVSTGTSISIDSNNTTTTPLSAGATFTGTAKDISAYNQINIDIYARPGIVAGDGSSAKASFYFEFSKDGSNWDVSVPHFIRDPSLVIPIPVINVHKYFRVRYLNDGGSSAIMALGLTETAGTPTAQTTFRLTSYLLPLATKELTRTLDQTVTGSAPVGLSRTVIMGKSTDDTYQNLRADGIVSNNSSSTNLGVGGVFTGSWFDAKGYAAYSVLVNANVTSQTDGLAVQFSDNASTVRSQDLYTYTSINTGIRHSGPTDARYIRIVYTNGGTSQSSFFLETTLTITPAQVPVFTPEATFDASTNIVTGRNVIVAKNPSGTYGNIERTALGGLKTAIEPLSTDWQAQQTSVTSTAAQFGSTPLTSRKTITFLANSDNTKIICVGKTSGVTTTSGGFPLGPGASMTLELDSSISTFWVIAESGTQRITWIEIA